MSGFTITELHEIPARDQWIPTVAEHLGSAIDHYPGFRDMAQEDSDFEPVRDDPSIQTLVGGPR